MERKLAEPTFTDLAVADLGSPRALEFFRRCQQLIDFQALAEGLKGLHQAASSGGGAPHWPVVLMLKVLFLQKVFGLSDPMTEQMLKDRISFRMFVGLSFDDKTPDETTIWNFRERLGNSGLAHDLFTRVVENLRNQGVIVNQGTLIDATIIETPLGRKRADGTHTAAEGSSKTSKGGRAYHGYRAHLSTDRRGFITGYIYDTASVSEHTHFDALAAGETKQVYADSGCRSRQRVKELRQRGVKARLCCRRVKGQRELSPWQKKLNRLIAPIRVPIEHAICDVKKMLRDRRWARYRTLNRNATDFALCGCFANLLRSGRYLITA